MEEKDFTINYYNYLIPYTLNCVKIIEDSDTFKHSLRVAKIAQEYFTRYKLYGDEVVLTEIDYAKLYVIALLHDVVEFEPESEKWVKEVYSKDVYEAVLALTRPSSVTYIDYIHFIIDGNVWSQIIKVADLIDHLKQKETLTSTLKERYKKAWDLLVQEYDSFVDQKVSIIVDKIDFEI